MKCSNCKSLIKDKTLKKDSRSGITYARTLCKACIRERKNSYMKRNPLQRRDQQLKHKFGISLMDYQLLLLAQNKKCAICNKRSTEKNKHFDVDHDHKTGKIRGLLCSSCNLMLGKAKDSIKTLTNAIKYLEN